MKDSVQQYILLFILVAGCFTASLPGQVSVSDPQETATQDEAQFSAAELEQLVAPIALYPDELAIQIMMASTYPLEVVQAQRFVEQNQGLSGKPLEDALEKQPWDESVKSLVNFPDVLAMMNDKLDWIQKLGDAVIAQEADVLSAVQRLRKRAHDAGNLKSGKEQTVIYENQTIIIEPAEPDVIYVPRYNPTVVYGVWPYPAFPVVSYFPRYYYGPGAVVWGFAAPIGFGFAWRYAWGGCYWGHGRHGWIHGRRHCTIHVNRYRNVNRRNRTAARRAASNLNDRSRSTKWQHNPRHRRGVRYRSNKVAQRFNRGGLARDAASRAKYRGRIENSTRKRRTSRTDARTSRRTTTSAFGGYQGRSSARGNSTRGRTSRSRSTSSDVRRPPSREARSSSSRTRGSSDKSPRTNRSRSSSSSRSRGSMSRGGSRSRSGAGRSRSSRSSRSGRRR